MFQFKFNSLINNKKFDGIESPGLRSDFSLPLSVSLEPKFVFQMANTQLSCGVFNMDVAMKSNRICLSVYKFEFIELVLVHNMIWKFPRKTSIKCLCVCMRSGWCLYHFEPADRWTGSGGMFSFNLFECEGNKYKYVFWQGKTSNFLRKQNRRELYLSVGRSISQSTEWSLLLPTFMFIFFCLFRFLLVFHTKMSRAI